VKKKASRKSAPQVELPEDKFDERVLAHIKTLAAHWRVYQKDVVWLALVRFVEQHPLSELHRMLNPFDGEDEEKPD
jgi:hypothetical protein